MLETFNDLVQGLPSPLIYSIVAALVFAEAALFFGFVFPGETAIIVGGVLASQGRLSMPLLLIIVVISAIVGDSVGYEIGRKFGPRLLETRAMRKHRSKVGKAQELIRRRGAFAVFIGRFTALLRALMPALAGSARVPYRKFLLFNAIGGLTWGVGFTLGGFFLGTAFEHTAQLLGRGLAAAAAVLAIAAAVIWSVRRHRREPVGERIAAKMVDEAADEIGGSRTSATKAVRRARTVTAAEDAPQDAG
ncbi:DedA family protein [Actinomadura sp. HBU206391]|uniref:DedA family protein n=1 Tax=Actinomadura sp. HBU206391 TaxID=2731692 RepID=UPI00164F2EDA|nr:DedA family protein [Actinomadura sp. HBU206391]MBC6458295.1 DedA family protein [Actinomadura sp. HBU206391]